MKPLYATINQVVQLQVFWGNVKGQLDNSCEPCVNDNSQALEAWTKNWKRLELMWPKIRSFQGLDSPIKLKLPYLWHNTFKHVTDHLVMEFYGLKTLKFTAFVEIPSSDFGGETTMQMRRKGYHLCHLLRSLMDAPLLCVARDGQ